MLTSKGKRIADEGGKEGQFREFRQAGFPGVRKKGLCPHNLLANSIKNL